MTVLFFLLGLIIGSFLSVVFSRLEIDEHGSGRRSVKNARKTVREATFGRSRCDHCHKQIAWYDNIPLISYLWLRGNCRHCHKHISAYHPVLELSSALLFAAAYLTYGLSAQFAIMLFFGTGLLLIFAYDLKHQIIPDVIVIPAIAFALATLSLQFALQMGGSGTEILLTSSTATPYVLGGLFFGGFFLALSIVSKGTWIGGGDIKLGFLLGLLLGWPLVLVNLVLAYLIGTLYAVIMLLSRRASLKTYLPFGPMLVLAFFITAYYGEQIVNWYETWFL